VSGLYLGRDVPAGTDFLLAAIAGEWKCLRLQLDVLAFGDEGEVQGNRDRIQSIIIML
jgi:hypothetical protein